jgi:hypothetical protein
MWLLYALGGLIISYIFYQTRVHPLANVPGPFLAKLTPLWLVWQCMNYRRPRLDLQLHKNYGSVVRIAPNEIIFSNPAYFREVYGAGTKFTKSRYYEVFGDKLPHERTWDSLDMLVEMDVAKLKVQKRLGVPVYSHSERHQGLIDNNLRRWMRRLSTMGGRPIDLWRELELLVIDGQTEVTFGSPFGAVEKGDDGGQMKTFDGFWKVGTVIGSSVSHLADGIMAALGLARESALVE